jgi:hypothetical protein
MKAVFDAYVSLQKKQAALRLQNRVLKNQLKEVSPKVIDFFNEANVDGVDLSSQGCHVRRKTKRKFAPMTKALRDQLIREFFVNHQSSMSLDAEQMSQQLIAILDNKGLRDQGETTAISVRVKKNVHI